LDARGTPFVPSAGWRAPDVPRILRAFEFHTLDFPGFYSENCIPVSKHHNVTEVTVARKCKHHRATYVAVEAT